MSTPECQSLGYEVRVVGTFHLVSERVADSEEAEAMPVAVLDFDNAAEAAAVMFRMTARQDDAKRLELFYEPWCAMLNEEEERTSSRIDITQRGAHHLIRHHKRAGPSPAGH